jgi:hypothetical protein
MSIPFQTGTGRHAYVIRNSRLDPVWAPVDRLMAPAIGLDGDDTGGCPRKPRLRSHRVPSPATIFGMGLACVGHGFALVLNLNPA